MQTGDFTVDERSYQTRNGYEFDGWTGTDLSEKTITVTIAQGSTGDRKYAATWTPNGGKSREDAPNKPTFRSYSLILDGGTATQQRNFQALEWGRRRNTKDSNLGKTVMMFIIKSRCAILKCIRNYSIIERGYPYDKCLVYMLE